MIGKYVGDEGVGDDGGWKEAAASRLPMFAELLRRVRRNLVRGSRSSFERSEIRWLRMTNVDGDVGMNAVDGDGHARNHGDDHDPEALAGQEVLPRQKTRVERVSHAVSVGASQARESPCIWNSSHERPTTDITRKSALYPTSPQ